MALLVDIKIKCHNSTKKRKEKAVLQIEKQSYFILFTLFHPPSMAIAVNRDDHGRTP